MCSTKSGDREHLLHILLFCLHITWSMLDMWAAQTTVYIHRILIAAHAMNMLHI